MDKEPKSDDAQPGSSTIQASDPIPITITRPGHLEGLVQEDEFGVGLLEISEKSKKRRRKRNKRGMTLQSAQSLSSSLPTTRTQKDVTDARTSFAKPSVTDARPSKNPLRRQSAVEPPREPTWNLEARSPVADMYFEEYNMGHPRRGVALILNHVNFETEEVREGSDKDCAKLQHVLPKLGFEVRVETDLTFDRVLQVLRNLSQEDHSLSDCLLIAVLTHGARGELYAHDHTYEVDKLWMNFTADRCPSLAGKPKIFIVQACRGDRFDPGTVLRMPVPMRGADAVDASGGSVRYAIPNHADIIVANATIEGFYAWRNPVQGSWFIQTLCDQLELHCESRDLQTILTFVTCRVAIHFESDVPRSPLNKMKQIPCVLSMLTRLVYLRRKNYLRP